MSNLRHADEPQTRMRSFAVTYRDGGDSPLPHHLAPPNARDWHLLIYAVRGVIRVTTQNQAWIVPPHRAVWLPGGGDGMQAALRMQGEVALRMLYVRAGPRGLPRQCTVVNVNSLLRELILRTCRVGALDTRRPEQGRLAAVILDELRCLQRFPLQLPLPSDPRAARFAALAGEHPVVSPPVHLFARQCGASRRTLERVFREETSLSLGQWIRRQVLLHALARLGSQHQSVEAIATELGYSSASAFIAMFRKELGETPSRYLTGRRFAE